MDVAVHSGSFNCQQFTEPSCPGLRPGTWQEAEWDTSRSPLFIKKKKMTREELRFYFPEEFLPNGSVISF